MPTETTATTLRDAARSLVSEAVTECATLSHKRNYRKLHVRRDGTIGWYESINQSDDLIDSGAGRFAAVPSVCCVGTGSCVCNCDHCNDVYSEADEALAAEQGREYDRDAKYATDEAAIADAVCESDLSSLEADMLAEFDRIAAGYFDDEER